MAGGWAHLVGRVAVEVELCPGVCFRDGQIGQAHGGERVVSLRPEHCAPCRVEGRDVVILVVQPHLKPCAERTDGLAHNLVIILPRHQAFFAGGHGHVQRGRAVLVLACRGKFWSRGGGCPKG